MMSKTAGIIFAIVGTLSIAGKAAGQCRGGDGFVVCPSLDTIYIVNDSSGPTYIAALSLSRGEVKWRTNFPDETLIRSNPAATVDVAAVSLHEPVEEIEAFDARTGKPVWTVPGKTFGMASVGTYIFGDKQQPGGIIVIDGKTGKTIPWKIAGNPRDDAQFFGVLNGTLLTDLYAIDAYSGRVLKRWPADWDVSAAAFGKEFVAVGTSWAAGKPTPLAVYSLPNYRLLWVRNDPQKRPIEGLAAEADHIFTAIYSHQWSDIHSGEIQLEMVAAFSGKIIWNKTIRSAELLPSPVGLLRGVAVFATGDSENSRTVQGFDAATGQLKWAVRTDHKISEVVCADSTCYIDAPGEVLAIDVQTGAESWLRVPNQ
jgi:outer membrane protein assembly factor BamB